MVTKVKGYPYFVITAYLERLLFKCLVNKQPKTEDKKQREDHIYKNTCPNILYFLLCHLSNYMYIQHTQPYIGYMYAQRRESIVEPNSEH